MATGHGLWYDGVDAGWCAQFFMVETFSPEYNPSHLSEPVDGIDENDDEVGAESDDDAVAAAASVARWHVVVTKSMLRPPNFRRDV
eukprot:4551184-Amphidinium_carterae.1